MANKPRSGTCWSCNGEAGDRVPGSLFCPACRTRYRRFLDWLRAEGRPPVSERAFLDFGRIDGQPDQIRRDNAIMIGADDERIRKLLRLTAERDRIERMKGGQREAAERDAVRCNGVRDPKRTRVGAACNCTEPDPGAGSHGENDPDNSVFDGESSPELKKG